MCPDKKILSAYADNEIERKFAIIIEQHIDSCPKCAKKIEKIKSLRSTLLKEDISENEIDLAKDRVWAKIQAAIDKPNRVSLEPYKAKQNIWDTTVAIPFPSLVAAASFVGIFIVVAVLNFYSFAGSRYNTSIYNPGISFSGNDAVEINLDTEDIVNLELTLPEPTVFTINGDPLFIKEVDYSGDKE